MNIYRGTYSIKGGALHAATFTFLKDKLSIKFTDENNTGREVYWYYDEIIRSNFYSYGNCTAKYKGYPEQVIETSSAEFAAQLEAFTSRENKRTFIKVVARVSPLLRVLFVIFLLLLAVYLWLVPYLAVKLAEKVPVSYEENLGQRMYNAMKGGFEIDEKKTMYINDFFKELAIPSSYHIAITVVKDDVSNAFALPGGNIIVYDKILAGMNDYEELAALLSHEFTHVQNKHTTKSLFRQIGNSVFLNIFFGNTSAISNAIISNADNLKTLSYSRSLETEADKEGLKILAERKIDGNGFVELFQMLKQQNNIQTSEWMSSHPDLEQRIEYIEKDPSFNRNGITASETLKAIFLKIKTGR
ncbi:MAG: M48 family metallopeptidase [Bacteroidota bacterium]